MRYIRTFIPKDWNAMQLIRWVDMPKVMLRRALLGPNPSSASHAYHLTKRLVRRLERVYFNGPLKASVLAKSLEAMFSVRLSSIRRMGVLWKSCLYLCRGQISLWASAWSCAVQLGFCTPQLRKRC